MRKRKLSEETPRKKKRVKILNKNGIPVGSPRPPRPQTTREDIQ